MSTTSLRILLASLLLASALLSCNRVQRLRSSSLADGTSMSSLWD